MVSPGEDIADSAVRVAQWKGIQRRIDMADGKSYMVCDNFVTSPFREDRIDEIHGNNVGLLCELSENPAKSLSAQEEIGVSVLMKQGMLAKRGEEYYPEIVIFQKEKLRAMSRYMKQIFAPESKRLQDTLVKTIHKHLFPHVRGDLQEQYYHYVMEIFMIPSSYMVQWGKEKQIFELSENPDTCAAGIHIIEM